jgi:lipopolysaccharide transport system ATP-binding protein
MSDTVIKVENLSKQYRLGLVGTGTLAHDLNRWWCRMRGKEDPYLQVGQTNDRTTKGSSEYVWALKDVNFEVKRGEMLGIIGRNGAGKSTLLKILSRVTAPTTGSVKARGRIAALLEVGTGFHPELTGRENLYLNGALNGMTQAEVTRKFDEIVDFSGCERYIDTPVKRYSSGMSVRLGFAVAAHLEPEILIVDEVLAVGDAEFQKKCIGKMQDVAGHGRTVLFVSHNMNAIEQLCSSVLVLSNGELIMESSNVGQTIKEYLKISQSLGSESFWSNEDDAFSNQWFKPLKVSISNSDGTLSEMPVKNDDDFYVRIDGIVYNEEPAMQIGYRLYSDAGVLLYESLSTDGDVSNWPDLAKGAITLIGKVPNRILNEGDYYVELLCTLHNREWLVGPHMSPPRITLNIRGGLSESPYWTRIRPGILGPELAWKNL